MLPRYLLLSLLCAAPSFAFADNTRQAQITGGSGSPKCTLEVVVDIVADVEIRGTSARLITRGGREAEWRRFVCNQPMPANPANFRFSGVDGRGRQTLTSDPSRNGVAVVTIEDPKAGTEGYTFDIEWAGSGNGFQNSPPPLSPPNRNGFSSSDAIHRCADSAESQLRSNGYSDTRVTEAKMDDDQGGNNNAGWISGSLYGRRNNANSETFRFACSVDFQSRQVGPVRLRPANNRNGFNPSAGSAARWDTGQAKQACSDAVQQRMQADGYRDIRMDGIDYDNQARDRDRLIGGVSARRDGFRDSFDFSCSIDLNDSRVRSVNIDRRDNAR